MIGAICLVVMACPDACPPDASDRARMFQAVRHGRFPPYASRARFGVRTPCALPPRRAWLSASHSGIGRSPPVWVRPLRSGPLHDRPHGQGQDSVALRLTQPRCRPAQATKISNWIVGAEPGDDDHWQPREAAPELAN